MINIIQWLREDAESRIFQDEVTKLNQAADEITNLRAELVVRDWQLIKFLPKKGKDVILLNADRMLVLSMSPEHFWKTRTYPTTLRFEATHWMPFIQPLCVLEQHTKCPFLYHQNWRNK